MAAKWIARAVEHKGALHKKLGVPMGQKISAAKLAEGEKMGGKTAKMVNLAKTLKSFH